MKKYLMAKMSIILALKMKLLQAMIQMVLALMVNSG
jgi:hypothetical protein